MVISRNASSHPDFPEFAQAVRYGVPELKPEMIKGLTLEKTGDDAYCRLDSHPVASAPRRTRTYNPLIKSQQAGSPKGSLPNDLRQPDPSFAHHLPTDTCKIDPDLAAIVVAWPHLP